MKHGRSLLRIILVAMVAIHFFLIWKVRDRIAKGDPDFTVFYTAGRMLREGRGHQLYDLRAQFDVQHEFASDFEIRKGPLPYIHPPFEALLFVPFTWLPYTPAYVAWDLVNVGLLALMAAMLRRSVALVREVRQWELMLGFLAFFPVFFNFLQGQDAILLLVCVSAGYVLLGRGQDFVAGLVLGVGLFKYQFTLPLVLILLLWKRKKVAAGFASMGLLLALVSVAITGWSGIPQYVSALVQVTQAVGRGQVPYGLMPNLLGLAMGWDHVERFSVVVRAIVLAISAGLIASVAHTGRRVGEATFPLAFSLAVVTAVVVSYQASAHDLCLLLLPIVLITDYLWRPGMQREARLKLLFPAMPLLVSPVWIFLWAPRKFNLAVVLLLWWIARLSASVRMPQEDHGDCVPVETTMRNGIEYQRNIR